MVNEANFHGEHFSFGDICPCSLIEIIASNQWDNERMNESTYDKLSESDRRDQECVRGRNRGACKT